MTKIKDMSKRQRKVLDENHADSPLLVKYVAA